MSGSGLPKKAVGFLFHAGAFLVFGLGGKLHAHHLSWLVMWAIGLTAHGLVVLPSLFAWFRAGEEQRAEANARRAEQKASVHSPVARGFLGESLAHIDALERQQQEYKLNLDLDLDGLRTAVRALDRRTEALIRLGDESQKATLQMELERAEAAARLATDEVTTEAHEQEAAAIRARIVSLDGALATKERLQARQRTLLHQLAGLKTAAAHALATEAPSDFDDLGAQSRQLQSEVHAVVEVEEEMARSRRAAAKAQQRQL